MNLAVPQLNQFTSLVQDTNHRYFAKKTHPYKMNLFKNLAFIIFLASSSFVKAQDVIPLAGKWNAGNENDYTAIWRSGNRYALLNGDGTGAVNSVTADIGENNDIPFTLDYTGDDRDEIALYRPSTREVFFYSDIAAGKMDFSITIGNTGDKIFSGDWDGNGKDGLAVYRPSTREIWFYQECTSIQSFNGFTIGNNGDIPFKGDWNGDGQDGYGLYRPSTRQLFFYQDHDSPDPMSATVQGNNGDIVVTGDWNGDGSDGYALFRATGNGNFEFWASNAYNTDATMLITWNTPPLYDASGGRQTFYTQKVPHTDINGTALTDYNPSSSFFPKGLYTVDAADLPAIINAGYNLGFLWPSLSNYPLSNAIKNSLDAAGNNFKTILYFKRPGGKGRSFFGKFNGSRDQIGLSSEDSDLIVYDTDNDNKPDKQLRSKIIGGIGRDSVITGDWNALGHDGFALYQAGSGKIIFYNEIDASGHFQITQIDKQGVEPIVFSGDWNGDAKDDYAVYNPVTRQIRFFDNTTSNLIDERVVGNLGDIPLGGDWDGDGYDGFALYNPGNRQFWFFNEIGSSDSFLQVVIGDDGDTPISGDWDGDGHDGIGVYKVSPPRDRHEFWMFNNICNLSTGVVSSIFGSPMVDLNQPKYVFGMYTADEPIVTSTLAELTGIYNAYSGLSPYVFFHVDAGIVPQSDALYQKWAQLAQLGQAVGHFDYPINSGNVTSISHIARTVTATRLLSQERIPNWFAAQTFQQLDGTGSGFHKPTPDQLKAMVYTAIVH